MLSNALRCAIAVAACLSWPEQGPRQRPPACRAEFVVLAVPAPTPICGSMLGFYSGFYRVRVVSSDDGTAGEILVGRGCPQIPLRPPATGTPRPPDFDGWWPGDRVSVTLGPCSRDDMPFVDPVGVQGGARRFCER